MERLRLLLDSNVFYACISISKKGQHRDSEQAVRLREMANDLDHEVWLSAATDTDISHARDPALRRASTLFQRQWKSLKPVGVPGELLERARYAPPLNENDAADAEMLAAVDVGAVDFLITQDRRLRQHADYAGLGDRVLTISDAIDLLGKLSGSLGYYPTVTERKAYELDLADPIFESLRQDYETFDQWFSSKVIPQHRDCLVIEGPDGMIDGLAILDIQTDEHDLNGPYLKLCTFKIGSRAEGEKRGELLLKASLDYAAVEQCDGVFLEVFEKHVGIVHLMDRFGFEILVNRTNAGELVMVKQLRPTSNAAALSPLEYHRRFGPPAVKVESAFIVPVQPTWHDTLFPEARFQTELLSPAASGNAILKAYLTRSGITTITTGALIVFYRSHDVKGATIVGVVDDFHRSADPAEIRRFVGQRTVYTDDDIAAMCAEDHDVLAILFRQDRILSPPWPYQDLINHGLLNGPPQAPLQITNQGALIWVRQQLDAPR